jgi:hypothetical protein
VSATKRTAAPVNDNATNQPSAQTFTIPGTCAVGDIVIFGMSQNTGVNTFASPPGWSSIGGPIETSSNLTSRVWAKKLVAGDIGASVTFTASGSGRMTAGYIVIQGGDLISEIRAATPTTGTTGDPFATPTVTTVEADNFICEIVFVRAAVAVPVTLAPVSGLTEDAECNTNFASSPNFAMGIYHPSNSGAVGSYGGQSVDANQAITSSHRYTFAIASAANGGGGGGGVSDPGMRILRVMEDGTTRKVTVYAVKADGTLAQLTSP